MRINEKRLTGRQIDQFRDALYDVFDREEIKDMLITDLDINIDDIPQTGRFRIDVLEVIRWVEKEEKTLELLQSAYRRKKTNGAKLLREFAQLLEVDLSTNITTQSHNATIGSITQLSSTTSSSTPQQDALQRRISDTGSILKPAQWRTQLAEIERHICRIEINDRAVGTGFLVGPDIVITCYHVMEDVINGLDAKEDVILRFDYKYMEDGKSLNTGTTHQLAKNEWLIDHSYHSQLDRSMYENLADRALHELDYALLRMNNKPDEEWVNSNTSLSCRKYMRMPHKMLKFTPHMPLYIIHHPDGNPLTLTQDTNAVINVNNNNTRVRYRTNTEYGSSGSPCFTKDWELVAMHQSGDPDFHPSHQPEYNQGVPIAIILALLEKRGKKHFLEDALDDHDPVSIFPTDPSSILFMLLEGDLSAEIRILLFEFLKKCKPGKLDTWQVDHQRPILLTEEDLSSIAEQLCPAHISLLVGGYMNVALCAVEKAQMPFINIGEMRSVHFQQAKQSLQRINDCFLKIRTILNAASSLPPAISVGREQLVAEVDRLTTFEEELIAHIDQTEKPHCDPKERRFIIDECRDLREALNEFSYNLQGQEQNFR